jgi:hypothetical protein
MCVWMLLSFFFFLGKNQAIYTSSICRMKEEDAAENNTYSLTTIDHDSLFATAAAAAHVVGSCTVARRRKDME